MSEVEAGEGKRAEGVAESERERESENRQRQDGGEGWRDRHPKEHLLRLGLARDPLQLAWQLHLAGTMAVKERDRESGRKV